MLVKELLYNRIQWYGSVNVRLERSIVCLFVIYIYIFSVFFRVTSMAAVKLNLWLNLTLFFCWVSFLIKPLSAQWCWHFCSVNEVNCNNPLTSYSAVHHSVNGWKCGMCYCKRLLTRTRYTHRPQNASFWKLL